MKNGITLVLVGLGIILISWFVRSDFEVRTYENLQEAMDKSIPFKVNRVIHTTEYDGVTIVMYSTIPDDLAGAQENEALGLAYFKGNDEDGWENVGHHGWSHYHHDQLSLYSEPFREYDSKGRPLHDFHVAYGQIVNPEIIEVKARVDETYEKIDIITNEWKRYYLTIGEVTAIKGLSKDGEVLSKHGE
ncbi:hypothetical protein ACTWQB_10435 [Piscibacillus sp. B03]|uniref:hypothetical protein n=1 Tax=Piscibacillus sp. B03 TaxID=3457430 RepID=UPI003FCD2796